MASKKFFSIERAGRVLWLKSPGGRRMFYTSVQCVGPKHGSRVPGAPAYDGIAAAGGSLQNWIDRTEARLRKWGMKGLGAWNHRLWRYRDLPYTECLNIWNSLGTKPIFDADWKEQVEKHVTPQIRSIQHAPSLIGYFLDNEIRWRPEWLFAYFDGRAENDPNRRAVLAFLRGRHRSVSRLNRAWGTRIRSFSALAKMKKLPVRRDAARGDMDAFLGVVARKFFSVTCRMVRQLDPHRLILGVRYAGVPPMSVVKGQRGNTDVVSMNLYIQEGDFPVEAALSAHMASGGQPIWITEFSWHAPFDNRSGDRNTIGFGSRVRYQKSRGRGYERFVSQAASLPFVIGCDWFQWCDESPMGRGDGEDVNFGLVDIKDRPYEDLVSSIGRTNRATDRLHAGSGKWKFKGAAATTVPVCAVPRIFDRNSEGARLAGMRFRPSLDPLPARIPVEARVGWRPDGLAVSVSVADSNRTVDLVKVKKSIEWFWMTDAVEILVRSGNDNVPALDAESVKVWAVPDGLGPGRPFVGALRRHTRVFGSATGIKVQQGRCPGGYRLDFLLPARLFQRGPLKPWQSLRANVLVEDCEKVTEVYWSAHGGDWTTEKPATWGRFVLIP